MFDQTKQAVVLENGEFTRHNSTIQAGLAAAHGPLADLYARIPDTETAMERRGTANSLRDADRSLIETCEVEAQAAQRCRLEVVASPPRSSFGALLSRLIEILP